MNNLFESFGVGFGDPTSCQEFLELTSLAEKSGFTSLWIQEGSQKSSLILAAAALQTSRKLVVGTGITSPFRRHPQILGMETATLNELSGGRFILGLGAAENSMINYGVKESAIQAMRETLEIVKGTFSTDGFTYQGKIFSINTPQKRLTKLNLPIYVGAIGPRMLDLASQFADGLLITRRGGFSREYVKYAIARIAKGAEKEGRATQDVHTLAFFETSLSKDGDLAREHIKPVLATYTIPQTPPIVLEIAGINKNEIEQVKLNYVNGDREAAINSITDEMIEKFSLSGTPEECLNKLRKYQETGLRTPILQIHGPNKKTAIELAAKEIVPQLTHNYQK